MIHITENAREKINSMIEDGKKLRIAVNGGGCSGFKYEFAIDKKSDDDMVFDDLVVIDPDSIGFIEESVLDFISEIGKSGFVIKNPNSVASCGCGVSFSI